LVSRPWSPVRGEAPLAVSRSIATRTGDDGTTSLLYGQRVPKDHPQIEAVGAFDEVNTAIGTVKALLSSSQARDVETATLLTAIQKNLVALMGEIACAESDVERYRTSQFEKINETDVQRLDTAVAALEAQGLKFDGWATPGANFRSAAFDFARTAARRAERRLVGLATHGRSVRPAVHQFTNRLSDLLWLLAREAEQ
jgi:cob(I)alamin adenosyltransferase